MCRLALAILPVALLSFAACGDDDSGDGGELDAAQADAAQESDASSEADAAPETDAAPEADAMPDADAMPSSLACAPTTLPSAAPATIEVGGTVTEVAVLEQNPLPGANIAAFLPGEDTPFTTTTSAADGSYSITAANPTMMPVDAFLLATAAEHVDTYVYPPAPVSQDEPNVPVLMLDDTTFGLLGTVYANPDQGAENGVVTILVVDCLGNPVDGATVTASSSTQVVYAGASNLPDATLTTTSPAGIAFVFNVPPGAVEVDAEVGDVGFHEHTVTSVAGSMLTTILIP